MDLFAKVIGAVNGAMMWICGIIGAGMAFLITVDIIMRMMKIPIQWAFEMTQWLSATMALLGGGYALLRGGHVKIDLIYKRFPARTRAILSVCVFRRSTRACWPMAASSLSGPIFRWRT